MTKKSSFSIIDRSLGMEVPRANPKRKSEYMTKCVMLTINGKPMLKYLRSTENGKAINSHYYLQCLFTESGNQCNFDERMSRLQDGTHKCLFSNRQLTLLDVLHPSPKLNISLVDTDIAALHATFVANSGLSFNMATSEYFYRFLDSVITRARKSPGDVPPSSIYPHLNRKQLKKKITEIAAAKYLNLLKTLRGQAVCVTIDAGSINMKHLVIVCIENPCTVARVNNFLYELHRKSRTRQGYKNQ